MTELYEYDTLIEDFLNQKISADQFAQRYADKFLRSNITLGEELFPLLDWFFAVVNGYTRDPELLSSRSPFYFDEKQLRASATETLQKLRALK